MMLSVLGLMAISMRRAEAQSGGPVAEALVGKTLYLRGFWMGTSLEFDGDGKLVGKANPGPVTLSGFHVQNAKLQGKKLVLKGQRVALVAGPDGYLKPQTIRSVTLLIPSFKKFYADEEGKITVAADESGGFEAPLKKIFAESLKELTSSVPPYWSCYANGYFEHEDDSSAAAAIVDDCIEQQRRALVAHGEVTPPQMIDSQTAPLGGLAPGVSVSGVSQVTCIVTKHGIPVMFQVKRAIGAGMEEVGLQWLAMAHFKPAEKDGQPVAVGFVLQVRKGETNY